MVNSTKICKVLSLEMIFLSDQEKKYSIFRINHLIRNLNKKKKGMKHLSEQKKKVIEQIAFYKEILQKLEQYEGDIHYGNEHNEPIFTEREIFYISMILGMRHCYERMKQLSKIHFTDHEKLHKDLQNWLHRVLELDPTLFEGYNQLNHFYNRIVLFSSTVETMRKPLSYEGLNEYQLWIQNLVNSFALLHDYESWRILNFSNDKWMRCCPAPCYCYIDDMEEIMYRIICGNVFFNQHRHQTPPDIYWWNKADSSFSQDN